jgi:hypothetical protein
MVQTFHVGPWSFGGFSAKRASFDRVSSFSLSSFLESDPRAMPKTTLKGKQFL